MGMKRLSWLNELHILPHSWWQVNIRVNIVHSFLYLASETECKFCFIDITGG